MNPSVLISRDSQSLFVSLKTVEIYWHREFAANMQINITFTEHLDQTLPVHFTAWNFWYEIHGKVWISWNLIWVDGRRPNGNPVSIEISVSSSNLRGQVETSFSFERKFIWPGKIGRFAISYAFNYETFVSSELSPFEVLEYQVLLKLFAARRTQHKNRDFQISVNTSRLINENYNYLKSCFAYLRNYVAHSDRNDTVLYFIDASYYEFFPDYYCEQVMFRRIEHSLKYKIIHK